MSAVYQPKMTPRDYQREACQKMNGKPAFALLMAMRTGKTKTLLDDFGQLELDGECHDLLVIAPAGVYKTWETAIKEHVSDDLARRVTVNVWASGSPSGKKRTAEFNSDIGGPRIFLVNVEALSVASTGAREACREFLAPRRAMIAVDESTVIKNYEAERTKFVNRVLAPLAEYRRILSGLPTPRSPLDLFSQFEFLSDRILGHKSYFSFKLHYAVVRRTDFGGKLKKPAHIVFAYRNQDELRRRIEPHSYRVEFRPNIPSTYSYREVPLTGKQKAIYAEMKKYATAQIEEGEHVTASLVIVQMLRLHQILMGYTIDETGKVHEIPENRTKALIDLLEEYNGKAIIWTSYDYSVRKIATALHEAFDEPMTNPDGSFVVDQNGDPVLENRVVARFWGGNANTREAEEKAFKEDPKCRFMVATPDSGGRGRTWDMADLVVYYGSKNNLEHREQSEQRPQNVGKERQVDYIDLIVPETVDGMIIKALRQKIDMATAITGDNYRQWLI